jgi:O-antigen/teichoic acid export membrane protein
MSGSPVGPVPWPCETSGIDALNPAQHSKLSLVRSHLREPLYRHSYFLLLATAVNAGTGFVFWLAAAHLSSATAIGRAAALLSAVSLLSYLTSLGLPYGMLRYGSARVGVLRILWFSLGITIATSVVAALVFAAGTGWWTPDLGYLVVGLSGFAIFALANAASAVAVLLDNLFAARRAAQFALARSSIVGFGRLLILAAATSYGARALFLATTVPLILASALFVLVGVQVVRRATAEETVRRETGVRTFLSYSVATYPSSLLAGAPPFFLPLVVLALTNAREAAFFYIASSIVGVLMILPTVISHMALSEGSRRKPWEVAARARALALWIVVPLVIALLLGAQILLGVYGAQYAHGGSMALRVLALSLVPWVFMTMGLGALRAEDRYRELIASTGLFAIVTIVLPIILGYRFGLVGVAAGWSTGVLITAIFMVLRSRSFRQSPIPLPVAARAPSVGGASPAHDWLEDRVEAAGDTSMQDAAVAPDESVASGTMSTSPEAP